MKLAPNSESSSSGVMRPPSRSMEAPPWVGPGTRRRSVGRRHRRLLVAGGRVRPPMVGLQLVIAGRQVTGPVLEFAPEGGGLEVGGLVTFLARAVGGLVDVALDVDSQAVEAVAVAVVVGDD